MGEQLGGNKGGPSSTNYLKELLFKLNVMDLGYSGNKFTWARGRWDKASIKSRLDRGVANISWQLAYPRATITHLGAIKSDHALILMDTNPSDSFAHIPFRFEIVWLRDDRCSAVIEDAWKGKVSGSEFIKLYEKKAATREALRKWNKEVFGHCQDKINSLLKKIKEVQDRQPSHENGLLENDLQAELSEWLLRSEVVWRQKSRELWLKLGDKNSNILICPPSFTGEEII
ncbi:uncharacterized protein LOC142628694 [Castanea sativa]|uniref:uncharacterized protein LOC142628694 n=1 Tax=Castanea sativa TaxID=21020 RepID=UPI003F652BAA